MQPGQLVESYKFWDVASLWSSERLEHDSIIARALVAGIIRDGLRFQSRDPKWIKSDLELRGQPFVGYSSRPELKAVILKEEVLQHLLDVYRSGQQPSREILFEEFVTKSDFRSWLQATSQALPAFWFSDEERA